MELFTQRSLLYVYQLVILVAAGNTSLQSRAAYTLRDLGIDSASLEGSLTALLSRGPTSKTQAFNRALQILNSLESRPSCFRLAASSLLTSCRSLENLSSASSSNSEPTVEDLNSKYAVRFALCELTEAHANIPPGCRVLLPSESACTKHSSNGWFRKSYKSISTQSQQCYPQISAFQFQSCLSALHGQSQSWTSYSNARQNAFVMCQATRAASEMEEHLKKYRTMMETTSDLNSALSESLRDALQFSSAVKKLQDLWMAESNQSVIKIQTSVNELFNDIRAAISSLNDYVSSRASQLELTLSTAGCSADEIILKLTEIRSELQMLRDDSLNQQAELGLAQNDHLYAMKIATLAMKDLVARFQNDTFATLEGEVDVLVAQVRSVVTGLLDDQANLRSASEAQIQEIKRTTAEFHRFTTIKGFLSFFWSWTGVGIAMASACVCFIGFLLIVNVKLAMCCAVAAASSFAGVSAIAFSVALPGIVARAQMICYRVLAATPSTSFQLARFLRYTLFDLQEKSSQASTLLMILIALVAATLLAWYVKYRYLTRPTPTAQENISSCHSRPLSHLSVPPPYQEITAQRWAYYEPKLDTFYFSE